MCACLLAALHAQGVVPPLARPSVLTVANSHKDYEQPGPLAQAPEAGLQRVGAALPLGGPPVVAARIFDLVDRGSRDALYLKPLQQRVDSLNVNGDQHWIALQGFSREFTDALHELLARYPVFSIFAEELYPGRNRRASWPRFLVIRVPM